LVGNVFAFNGHNLQRNLTKNLLSNVEGVKATAEGYIVLAILLAFHLYIMFIMGDIIYA
jgi:hypothetical protein